MRAIDADALMQCLGITDPDCPKCGWYRRSSQRCSRGDDFADACCAIDDAPTVPQWIPCCERLPEEHEWIGTKKFGTTISDEVYVTFETPDG